MTSKTAVILVNLGTPEEPTPKKISEFLKQFLSDQRVVEAPKLIWWFILRLIVIPLRAKKVAHAYKSIWLNEGSPLRVISLQQAKALENLLDGQNIKTKVLVAQTYGKPSLADQITELTSSGFEKFIVLPMYPQYSCSTTAPIYDQLAKLSLKSRNVPDVRVVKDFHNQPAYIKALANSVEKVWQQEGRGEKLLISFHGVPKSYVDQGDPYYQQCSVTAELLAQALNLNNDQWQLCFQSRFGPKEWLQPYTDETLKTLAENKVSSLDIISPAFVADCLETLEELNIENRELFLSSGGSRYTFIPCLNDDNLFIDALALLVKQELIDNNYSKAV